MADPTFVDRFATAGRPGSYLAIEQPGEIGAGDSLVLVHRPHHGITVGTAERAYRGHTDG